MKTARLAGAALVLIATSCSAQTWIKVASEGDTVAFTTVATLRYGAPQNATPVPPNAPCSTVGGCWVGPITTTPPQIISVSNANFGSDPIPGTLKELDIQQTGQPQTVNVNGVDKTIPAAPLTCPDGTYWGLATGVAGETVTVPAGMVYQVEPSTSCITATAQATVDVSQAPHLNVLRTTDPQTVLIMRNGQPTTILIDPLPAAPPATAVAVQTLSLVIGGQLQTCKPANPGSGGTFVCTAATATAPATTP